MLPEAPPAGMLYQVARSESGKSGQSNGVSNGNDRTGGFVRPVNPTVLFAEEMSKKRRGHYCRICGSRKPNEAFSGRGHRDLVCKVCSRMPKEQREAIEHEDEIFNYLHQSHISDKNVSRLKDLAGSENPWIAKLASIVLEVADVKPYKKRRLKVLARERPDLLQRLNETCLIMAHHHY